MPVSAFFVQFGMIILKDHYRYCIIISIEIDMLELRVCKAQKHGIEKVLFNAIFQEKNIRGIS